MVAIRGTTVLVTGGRRGLGSALVDEVLSRGATKVYSTAREQYSDSREKVVSVPLEVQDEKSVGALAAIASDVDIVINNAGILLPSSLLTGAFDDITTTFDINTLGPLRVTRAFAPILAGNGGGALVNVHSVLSWVGAAEPTAPPRPPSGRCPIPCAWNCEPRAPRCSAYTSASSTPRWSPTSPSPRPLRPMLPPL